MRRPDRIKFFTPADVEKSEKCLFQDCGGRMDGCDVRDGGGATIDGWGPANFQWNKLLPPENNGVILG